MRDDLTKEKMLACPFCGGAPYIIEDDSYQACHVGCNACELEPSVIRHKDFLSDAIAAWNKRAAHEPKEDKSLVELVRLFEEAAIAWERHHGAWETDRLIYQRNAVLMALRYSKPLETLQGRDEVAWLIEQSFNSKAHWWYGSDFTDDAAQAVRFARKQDADQVILERGMVDAVASEHMWCQFETNGTQS